MGCLRRAGHGVDLLAPREAGSALLGPGPGEVGHVWPWDAAATTDLFTGAGASAEMRERLGRYGAAVVYSRSRELADGLGAVIGRVIAHDPLPAIGSGHAADWLSRPLSALGVPRSGPPPTLQATAEERRRADAFLRDGPARFLAVHPGSGSPAKSWPADRFVRVLDALGVGSYVLVEGPADAQAAAVVRARGGAITAAGLDPRDLGAVLSRAAAYVGNDSGVSHLAAAWGTPTVALFGPTDPEVWAPVGTKVTVVRASDRRVDSIAVEEVVEAVRRSMTPGEGGPR